MYAIEILGSYTSAPRELVAKVLPLGMSAMFVTTDARMIAVLPEQGIDEPDWEASEGTEDDYDYPEYDGYYDDEPTYAQELAMYGGINW